MAETAATAESREHQYQPTAGSGKSGRIQTKAGRKLEINWEENNMSIINHC
jgi:hypothetical protein